MNRVRVGETTSVSGWVNTLRLQAKMQFVVVRDHTGMVQVTHRRGGEGDETETALDGLTAESAVRITGRVVGNEIVKLGGLELVPEQVEVLNRAETPLPIDEQTGLEHRLHRRFLDVRLHPQAQLLFAVQTTLEQDMREYAYSLGCTEMHTPKLMGTASESGAEVFKLGYFDRSAFLAQSPQSDCSGTSLGEGDRRAEGDIAGGGPRSGPGLPSLPIRRETAGEMGRRLRRPGGRSTCWRWGRGARVPVEPLMRIMPRCLISSSPDVSVTQSSDRRPTTARITSVI